MSVISGWTSSYRSGLVACTLYLACAAGAFALDAPRAVNAATNRADLAPGSIVALFYSNSAYVTDTKLFRVEVQSEGSTQALACAVLLSSSFQVWAVLPPETPLGPAMITLTIDGQSLPPASITLSASAPGIFSVSQFGDGAGGLAQNVDSQGVPSLNRLTNPALAGQYVTLWGTGLGSLTAGDVTVDLAGKQIPAAFAGHSPGFPGMDQVSFQIPADAFDGCYVPVTLRAGVNISNQVTIAKAAAPGACVHPLELSAAEMKTLDDGGSIPFGAISASAGVAPSLNPFAGGYYQASAVWARLTSMRASDIALLVSRQYPDSSDVPCQLENLASLYTVGAFSFLFPGPPRGALALIGPAGQKLEIIGDLGTYIGGTGSTDPVSSPDLLPPPFFSAGAWNLSLTGDSSVRDFQQVLQLPPVLHWTNRGLFTTVSRSADTVITWDPAGYSATDILSASLIGMNSTAISCSIPARSGSVTLPRALLSQLAPATGGFLHVGISGSPQRFNVQFGRGDSMPVIFTYGFGDTLQVAIR